MNATLFIVRGETGEYSDRSDWLVRAFLNRGHAEACMMRLAAWCDAHKCGENGPVGSYADRQEAGFPPDDPGFQCDYTGTRYSVDEVPIELSPCIEHDDCREHPDLGIACVSARRAVIRKAEKA